MKQATSERKPIRQAERTVQQDASAGPNAISIAPPAYGIDFVDRDLLDAAPIQRSAASSKKEPGLSGVRREYKSGLPGKLKAGVEDLSGVSMDDVQVHYNSSKPVQLQALAYTEGIDIHVGPGQEGHLPHEAWHVVQQKQGRVKPTMQAKGVSINDEEELEREAEVMGAKALQRTPAEQATASPAHHRSVPLQRVAQRSTNYIVQTSQRARLRSSPDFGVPEDFSMVEKTGVLEVDSGVELELLGSVLDWIEVRGPAIITTQLGPGTTEAPAGTRTGWIRRDETNLAPATDTLTENLRVSQDLDDLLDAKVIPAMLGWESGVRTQGQAYASAHQKFSDTLDEASKQAKARADFYAAVLTSVSVGALGWVGDAAMSAESVTKILRSEGLRGSIEDALQTGLGEWIDIAQGGWFTQHVNRETHPLRYLNGALRALADTRAELIAKVGTAKTTMGRAVKRIDRARVLVEMYVWWDNARLRHTPNVTQSDEKPMAREFERGFWAEYIKEDLTRIAPLPYYEGWTLHTYHHPESAVESRLDKLGISSEAGISEWDAWYEATDTAGSRDIGDHIRAIGSPWTQKLYAWATSYTPTTFS